MPVTFEQTKRKYRGRKAATYETIRKKQARWRLENEAVERYMTGARGSVLDVPVGTGRFVPLWSELGTKFVGIDSSEEMLRQARKKMSDLQNSGWGECRIGDASQLYFKDKSFRYAVCVRFLDLIPEDAMLRVLRELLRVSRDRVVLTIRLGPSYVHKSNTCTHDRQKFYRAVSRAGWYIDHATPIFKAGWEVMKLVPKAGPKK